MSATDFRPAAGDRVIIRTPHNERADRRAATVARVEEWGAHLGTAFGSGEFRAAWHEMAPDPAGAPAATTAVSAPDAAKRAARVQGYEGDPCVKCGAMKLRRNGACLVCDSCGETTGCS